MDQRAEKLKALLSRLGVRAMVVSSSAHGSTRAAYIQWNAQFRATDPWKIWNGLLCAQALIDGPRRNR